MATGGSIPLLCLEGVPRLPGEPQDEASLTREVEIPDPGIEPRSPALQEDSLPAEPQGKPDKNIQWRKDNLQ